MPCPMLSSIDPHKPDETGGRLQRPVLSVFKHQADPQLSQEPEIIYCRCCPGYILTVQWGFLCHLFSNQYSITKRKIHSLAHFQDEIMDWSNNT